ncbi:MAG TPA: response regulator [Candidatus Limnocylindria bacterium]|nr:response regulator [Candidatus Limnocylindria bacterium]
MNRHRVLIVDDESDIRSIARLALERVGGWQVFTAASGLEGVEIAVREQPEAILLDGAMPGMDGLATLRELREREETRHIPVVFITASVQAAQQRVFRSAGARAILAKPFDPMTLAAEVAAALGWKE